MNSIIKKIFFKLFQVIINIQEQLKLAYYKYLWKNQLRLDSSFKVDKSFNLQMLSGAASLSFSKGVVFRKYCSIICSDNGILDLGKNVFFNNYCSINCLYKITVGDNTIFGEGVRLYDHNHLYRDVNHLIREQNMKCGAIHIGANCWIGSNTIILPNVTIGNNVVIGANNLIYESIPDNVVVIHKAEKIIKPY